MQPRTPEHVQAALDALGLDIRVQISEQPTATAEEAAQAAGCELGAIVKSLCFLIDGQPLVILSAGDQRVDERKVAALHNVGRKKVRMADYETTISLTGYAPGGVPPVGHVGPLPVLIDETLARYPVVYAAAGSERAIFPIPFETLVAITGGRVADVARE